MRQFVLLFATILLGTFNTYCFADTNTADLTQALKTALKAQSSQHAKLDSHDLTIVYGGADISHPSSLGTTAV